MSMQKINSQKALNIKIFFTPIYLDNLATKANISILILHPRYSYYY